jgi:hypothetical protein
MAASGTPVIHVETHLASVCQGRMAVVIRDIRIEDTCRVANGLTREDAHFGTERDGRGWLGGLAPFSSPQAGRKNRGVSEKRSLHFPVEVPTLSTSPKVAKGQHPIHLGGMQPPLSSVR